MFPSITLDPLALIDHAYRQAGGPYAAGPQIVGRLGNPPLDADGRALPAVLERIIHEVLKDLGELVRIPHHERRRR